MSVKIQGTGEVREGSQMAQGDQSERKVKEQGFLDGEILQYFMSAFPSMPRHFFPSCFSLRLCIVCL